MLLLGTPVLWWGGVLALLYAVYALGRPPGLAVRHRRWSGVLATWLPWFRYDDRPIFSYYAIAILPFTIIAITPAARPRWSAGERASYRAAALGHASLPAPSWCWWW